MNIYNYQEAFGAWDRTSRAMKAAIGEWFSLYYQSAPPAGEDPCQRIAYTVVNKLVKTVFSEYTATSEDPATEQLLQALSAPRQEALQQALVGGECYLKPVLKGDGFALAVIPRNNALIFGRNAEGEPTDMGTVEQSTHGRYYYTLLERRRLEDNGCLTIENKLFRSYSADSLGSQCPLSAQPAYGQLPERYTFPVPLGGLGLVRMRTPMLNCVDGSGDGVAVYAAAAKLIHNIDRNEAQLCGEFDRGESRILVSSDLLDPEDSQLRQHLFVGLDASAEELGITVFAPQLRQSAFLERKQEYLRNVESIIGIKRGLLSDANMEQRTATEISASQGEYNLTVMDFQGMWAKALTQLCQLCRKLAGLYHLPEPKGQLQLDWGNGVLYDEEKTWADYKEMVRMGLLAPEIALGWRFGCEARTEAQRSAIRQRYLPNQNP